ncbi:hypothetical protein SLEP1_g32986 [Rubroshorea leprosula]|uniref:Uncharacterized protein n=1 Tax=Rubroshorea leprosula TaxID=152421 RepID=A0AAV5KFA9_9ROSI|nr:hypothetical protein SLEP1_g32986 [Rubroshorea leprosula]
MKKKEKEYIKLQERLNQVLMEKKKESRSGMEIMNLLQKEGRQRGTWNGKKDLGSRCCFHSRTNFSCANFFGI